MDLDTLIIEADPARRIPLAGPDSAAGVRLYRDITRRRPARFRRPPARGRLRRVPRRVTRPAAAFLAVTAVLAGTSVAVRVGWPAGAAGHPAGPGGNVSSRADLGMPPYYVTIGDAPVAMVRDSATGKRLATVRLPEPADQKLSQIAAAGDGRTFVLGAGSARTASFYRLLVAPGGHHARLARLPVPPLPAAASATAIALSPDGSKLAVAIQVAGSASHAGLEVISLATGTVRNWNAPGAGEAQNLSWADSGRELAFYWDDLSASGRSARTTKAGLWLIDPAAKGPSLMSGRRIALTVPGGDAVQSAQLAPDGTTVIAVVSYGGIRRIGGRPVVADIIELSARTGRPLRTLRIQRALHSPDVAGWYIAPCGLYAVDVTGRHLLMDCNGFGRLDNGRFTTLPSHPPVIRAAW